MDLGKVEVVLLFFFQPISTQVRYLQCKCEIEWIVLSFTSNGSLIGTVFSGPSLFRAALQCSGFHCLSSTDEVTVPSQYCDALPVDLSLRSIFVSLYTSSLQVLVSSSFFGFTCSIFLLFDFILLFVYLFFSPYFYLRFLQTLSECVPKICLFVFSCCSTRLHDLSLI